MTIYAFIFAIGGSKGLKNKNLKKINGKPLIFYSINIAKKIKQIKKVYVSTDNKNIEKIALKYGAEIIKRPKKLSQDKSAELLAWKHAVKIVLKKDKKFSTFVSLPATSPLKNKKDILNSIKLLKKNIDLVLTVKKSKWNPWFNMLIENKKTNNFELVNKNKRRVYQRQQAPVTFDIVGNVYVSKPKYILKTNYILSGKKKILEIPEYRSIDIDNIDDLNFAKLVMS